MICCHACKLNETNPTAYKYWIMEIYLFCEAILEWSKKFKKIYPFTCKPWRRGEILENLEKWVTVKPR